MRIRIRLRAANPWWRRLKRRLRAIGGAALNKTHAVDLAWVNGQRYKRVRFTDSRQATLIADALSTLRDTALFPELLHLQDGDLWLRFVPGEIAEPGQADFEKALNFFVRLYAATGIRVGTAGLGLTGQLDSDLRFLAETGVLSGSDSEALRRHAQALCPETVLLGFDYIDPLPKNFVITDAGAVGIDVEALACEQPLGQGLAKLLLRWPSAAAPNDILDRCVRAGVDIRAQFPWVRLLFLAAYTKQKVLQRKPGHIDSRALLQLLDRPAA